MKTFIVEGWYRYNAGNDKDYIIKEIVCNTPKQAIEIFNIKYKHIGFFKIDIKEIIMKQETIEEFAERYIKIIDRSENGFVKELIILGATWQQERSYSDEDMILYSDYVLMCSAEKTFKLPLQPKEWFEKFSKLKNG